MTAEDKHYQNSNILTRIVVKLYIHNSCMPLWGGWMRHAEGDGMDYNLEEEDEEWLNSHRL